MREGELLELRWRDVDLAGERLAVTGLLQRDEDGWVVREPKTHHSRRPVLLTQSAVRALKSPQNLLQRVFYPLLERAGLSRCAC
jgi:integrase